MFNDINVDIENDNIDSKITMRSWIPMPQTFVEWDTTNNKHSFSQFINDKEKDKEDYHWLKEDEITDELKAKYIDEYDAYSKGYDDAVEHQNKEYGVVGWYDYNCKTLGTKWDAELLINSLEINDDEISVIFDTETAWSFPEQWVVNC